MLTVTERPTDADRVTVAYRLKVTDRMTVTDRQTDIDSVGVTIRLLGFLMSHTDGQIDRQSWSFIKAVRVGMSKTDRPTQTDME